MLRVNIKGHAMSPTLKDGESALAMREFDTLDRRNIVAVYYPKDEAMSFVRRIVGMPGDRIVE